MASEAESPRMKLTEQQALQFQGKMAKESICMACSRQCDMQMVICEYCNMFNPTLAALDVLKAMFPASSA